MNTSHATSSRSPFLQLQLHFGVDSRADCFKVEVRSRSQEVLEAAICSCCSLCSELFGPLQTTAYNDATFRQPDEDGWSPKGHTICSILPHDTNLKTTLPAQRLTGGPRSACLHALVSICMYLLCLRPTMQLFASVQALHGLAGPT